MNVYQKLMQARIELQNAPLKKSGKNKFAGYSYFELGDFLPTIQSINAEVGLFTQISFSDNLATLTITNLEDPQESIEFTSPMASAEMKGALEIQRLGAVETYERRYLYLTAYEIVENDVVDSQKPTSGRTPARTPPPLTKDDPIKEFYKRIQDIGLDNDGVVALVGEFGYEQAKDIPAEKRQDFLNRCKHEKENQ